MDWNALREALADLEHDRWSRWQRYLHSKCSGVEGPMSGLLIHQDSVDHWERQIATPYAELSEREKDSDRKEADRTIEVIRRFLHEETGQRGER